MGPRSLAALALCVWLAAPARAEEWDPVEVAAAQRLQAEEAARAADYRHRVARGDVRAESAPRARAAPGRISRRSGGSAGDPLREAADLADLLERWFGGMRPPQGAAPPAERRAGPRGRPAERAPEPADDWWAEEERRLGGGR